MPQFVHIVYVHPVENGEPNLHTVVMEQKCPTKEQADYFIELYEIMTKIAHLSEQAVYYGCVNDETGELHMTQADVVL
jgi:hypothetical protein